MLVPWKETEPLELSCSDKQAITLYQQIASTCEKEVKGKHFLVMLENDYILPTPQQIKKKKSNLILVWCSNKTFKLGLKWCKRVKYATTFADTHEMCKPHALFAIPMMELEKPKLLAAVLQLLDLLPNDVMEQHVSFFELTDFCQSTKKNKREVLIQFIRAILVDQVSEKQALLLLAFRPPVFLNPLYENQYYIGNLYDYATSKKLKQVVTPESYMLCVLFLLHEQQAFNDAEYRALLKLHVSFNGEPKTEEATEHASITWVKNKANELDPTTQQRSALLQLLLQQDKATIVACAKRVKDLLAITQGKREEFSQEIKKQAWDKCKKLKIAKQIPKMNDYFKLDMYGGVISWYAISGGATGIQVDHDFPDALGV